MPRWNPNKGKLLRPVPEGFREAVESGMVLSRLALEFKTGRVTAQSWLDELGLKAGVYERGKQPPPEGFEDFVAGRSIRVVAAELGKSEEVVGRWFKELDIPFKPWRRGPDPDVNEAQLREMAKTKTTGTLADLYGVEDHNMRRTLKKLGIKAKRSSYDMHPRSVNTGNMGRANPSIGTLRDDSLPGQAAAFLKGRGFMGVYRMKVRDERADPNLWCVGRMTMTSGDMIDYAEERGFRPVGVFA